MKLPELQELEARWTMQTYARTPVEFVRGRAPGSGIRRACVPGLPRRDLGLLRRPLPSGWSRRCRWSRHPPHTSNLYLTEGGVRRALCSRASAAGVSLRSGTEASSVRSLVRKHAHGRAPRSPRSWCSRASAGRWARSARPGSPQTTGSGPTSGDSRPARQRRCAQSCGRRRAAAIMLGDPGNRGPRHPDEMIVAGGLRDATALGLRRDQTGMGQPSLWATSSCRCGRT
jgi:hypothetical protein